MKFVSDMSQSRVKAFDSACVKNGINETKHIAVKIHLTYQMQ